MSLGGIGYFNRYTEQGLSNIKTFVNQDESIAGNLLRAAVNTAMATWFWIQSLLKVLYAFT
jgi:hypothetical protein